MDLEGKRFGRLVVAGFAGTTGKHSHWWCRCDCGKITKPTTIKLRGGKTKSCGCHALDARRKAATRHGEATSRSRTSEYRSYHHMRRRCLNPKDAAFPDYGGRGITICDRWLNGEDGRSGLECFLADMGRKPSATHSLDRIDSDGNYEPSNCRWGTKKEQARNRRSNRYVEVRGERLSVPDACERLGVSYKMVIGRLKRGWAVDRAVHEPRSAR